MVQRVTRASTQRRSTPAAPSPDAEPVRPAGARLMSSLGLEGERMSKVDTAWLRMDSPSNLMMILGVWILRPGIDHAALSQRVHDRLLPYRRFVQTACEDAAGAHWADDPHFDLARHVTCRPLTPVRGQSPQAALQERVAHLAMQPLDPMHPRWQFELVEDYEGGSALIARIHHCIADGIALISVMMSLADGGGLPPRRKPSRGQRSAMDAAEDWVADTLIRPFGDITARALEAAGGGRPSRSHSWLPPSRVSATHWAKPPTWRAWAASSPAISPPWP